MNAPGFPLRARLRAVDERRAAFQTRLIDALNRRQVGDWTTTARLATEADRAVAAASIRFRVGEAAVRVAPLVIDGAVPHLTDARGEPDAAAAAAALGPLEPLLSALERVLRLPLHPAGLERGDGAAGDPDALTLRIDAGPFGEPAVHRMLVTVPDELAPEPQAESALEDLPLAPGAAAELRLRWTASAPGPAVALPRLGQIGPGDLMVLGVGPLLAQVRLPGRDGGARARIDLSEGNLVLEQDLSTDEGVVAGAPPQPAHDWGELRVATTVEMSGATLTAAQLATLGPGSVLPLDVEGGTLPVRVTAGDRLIARGELVAVGQGFGVLVTGVAHGLAGADRGAEG